MFNPVLHQKCGLGGGEKHEETSCGRGDGTGGRSRAGAGGVAQVFFTDPTLAGGTVSYDGAGGALVGTDILFQSIWGRTLRSIAVSTCRVSIASSVPPREASLALSAPSIPLRVVARSRSPGLSSRGSRKLLPAPWSRGASSSAALGTGGQLAVALGVDEKNADLVAFFGLGPDFTFAQSQIMLTGAPYNGTGPFSRTVSNADFNNVAVPEPASMFLLGTGLVGLAAAARRRVKK